MKIFLYRLMKVSFSFSFNCLDLHDFSSFKDNTDNNITKKKIIDGIFTEGDIAVMKQYMRKYSKLSLFDLGKMIYYKLKKRDSDRKYVYTCILKWIEKNQNIST